MSTVQNAVAILVAEQKPLAEKLKTLETNYRVKSAVITAQLKPLNKAISTLTPKVPKPPKAPKAPKPDKAAKKTATKEADVTLSNEPLFSVGVVVATPVALSALEEAGVLPITLLARHIHGDWGDMDTNILLVEIMRGNF